jgi:molybdopterin-guanine dinucleotide biosynthesis protein A
MGGGDKTLLRIGGRPLLSHILHSLTGQVGTLALSANGDPARFGNFSLPVLPDTTGFDAGPLAGVLAGLDWAASLGAEALLSVPGDTPFLPGDLARRLANGARTGGAVAASPDSDGRLRRHPTCALWQVGRRHALREALEGGLRKVGLWADLQNAATVRFESLPFDPFFNVNTPDDLAWAEAHMNAV